MIKKIIFIFSKYFENKDWDIFQCPYFLKKGYEIEIWSIVQIHYKGMAKEPLHMFRDYRVKYFEKINDFKYEIKTNEKKSTIFLVYPSLGENSQTGYIIRYIIRKEGFRYCDYCYPKRFSNMTNKKIPVRWIDIINYYLKSTREIKNLIFSILYPPEFVFMTAKENYWILANKFYVLRHNKLKYINTPDYDKFLNDNTKRDELILEREKLKKNQYILFLDEALTHHSDILNLGLKAWVTDDIYGKEICKLFDFLEDHTNMKVVIALHPKAEYMDSAIFGGRKMIDGETMVLIKYCNFVITSFSTAMSYIVLYKKPLLMYVTNQLIKNDTFSSVSMQRALGKYLDCKILNISRNIPNNLLDSYVKSVDESKRKFYINRLVCSRKRCKNVTSAQIIDNYLRKL